MTGHLDTLRQIVAQALDVVPAQVSVDADLVTELGLDSFAMMDLILTLEERFPALDFSTDEVSDIRTMRELARYLESG